MTPPEGSPPCSSDEEEEVEETTFPIMDLESTYTNEEMAWTNKTLTQLDQAFKSINYGEDIIKELLMYNLDVPVSRKFTSHLTRYYLAVNSTVCSILDNWRCVFKHHLLC